MKKARKDIAASIRGRLLNYSKQNEILFNRLLIYYFQERFLYRVSISKYRDDLILKGGALLLSLNISKSRPTQDIDFLLRRENLDHKTAKNMIAEIAKIQGEDGVIFHPKTIIITNIREDNLFNSIRIRFEATLGQALSKMQIDVGFKDSITPNPVIFEYPTILDLDAPKIVAYSWETVVAEKFEAMVKLYLFNSRLKDFYDILHLSQNVSFNSSKLKKSITSTFRKRKTDLQDALSLFEVLESEDTFFDVMIKLKQFLLPIIKASMTSSPFAKIWDTQKKRWR
jgi:predicted nucleotidyltransferase component of viral defense system